MGIPNLAQADQFLGALDPNGVFTFQTFADANGPGSGRLARVLHGSLDVHVEELSRLNAAGAGVFVMVNKGDGIVHAGQRSCRTAANVIAVRAVFVDLDGAPLAPLSTATTPPQIIVESSPGRYHGYWKVSDCLLEDFAAHQLALAEKFQGDSSVCDLPRVMRLPGFFHQKSEPFMTHVI